MKKCPKCGAGLADITLSEFVEITFDRLFVDVIATCAKCGAELNTTYKLSEIKEDI